MSRKKEKKKFDEDRYYRQRKFSHLMENLKNFNEIFRKDVTYDTNKNHKETGFHLFFWRCIFGNTTRKGGGGGWANWGQAPSLFKVKSAWTVLSLPTSKLFTSVSRQGKSVFDASVDAWKHFDHFRLTSIA